MVNEWFDEPPVDLRDCDIDLSAVECPKCGTNDVQIDDLPRPGTWFRASGRARCNECGFRFALNVVIED